MKLFQNKFLYIGLLALVTQACKKTVDLKPTDSINEDNVFQSVEDLEQGLYGVYGAWGGENTMYLGALLADEVKLSNENRGQGQFEFKWQYTSTSGTVIAGWETFYRIVGIINKELAAFENVTPADATEETLKEQIRAELLALRALAHFEMIQRYAGPYSAAADGIPYTTTSDITAKPSRLPMSEVLANIESELAAGKAGPLPTAPPTIGTAGHIRLSKSTIAGYQARVALYKGDWDNAITFATECITNSGKALASMSDFPMIWTDASDAELLFELRRTGTGVGTMWQDVNGDVFFEPSDYLKSLYDRTNDVRFDSYFKTDDPNDTALVYKFFTSSRGPKIVDVKMMRVAEMYLIRAEAHAEKSELTMAADNYNILRAARIAGYVNESFPSKNDAIAAIMEERARELAYEGFRFFDLKRKQMPVSRLASDVTSSAWQNLSANDFHFVLPIPQNSITSNPNMVQNPNY